MQQKFSAVDSVDIDCDADSDAGLRAMFVDIIQKGRIDAGQCPALRPVFHKVHGAAKGELVIRSDIAPELSVGIFKGERYPAWVRLSSDIPPNQSGFKTTLGIGMKLFGVPGVKLIGDPEDVTSDMIFQNHDVFFVDTAKDMCAFIRAVVIDGTIEEYLDAHPVTKNVLDAMAKPVASVLASSYWTILPSMFGKRQWAKFRLEPELALAPPGHPPADPDYLSKDLVERLRAGPARFVLSAQLRTDPGTMPLDQATVSWNSPFRPVADLILPQQNIDGSQQQDFAENLAFNIWRVTEAHRPVGSIARARGTVYSASATTRRVSNKVSDFEPKEP